jgi:hypothetical protein
MLTITACVFPSDNPAFGHGDVGHLLAEQDVVPDGLKLVGKDKLHKTYLPFSFSKHIESFFCIDFVTQMVNLQL